VAEVETSPDLDGVMDSAEARERTASRERQARIDRHNEAVRAAHLANAEVQAALTNQAVAAVPTALDRFLGWLQRNRTPLLVGGGSYLMLVGAELATHKLRQIRRGRGYSRGRRE